MSAKGADEAYKKRVEDTNNFLESYYTERMPKIMSQFEHLGKLINQSINQSIEFLESVRIHMLRTNLRKYVQVVEVNPPIFAKECKSLMDTVDKVNNEADIDFYVKQYKSGMNQSMKYQSTDQSIRRGNTTTI